MKIGVTARRLTRRDLLASTVVARRVGPHAGVADRAA